jgi:hypothetical protein
VVQVQLLLGLEQKQGKALLLLQLVALLVLGAALCLLMRVSSATISAQPSGSADQVYCSNNDVSSITAVLTLAEGVQAQRYDWTLLCGCGPSAEERQPATLYLCWLTRSSAADSAICVELAYRARQGSCQHRGSCRCTAKPSME